MLRIFVGFLVAALWLPLIGLLSGSYEGQFFAGTAAVFTVPLTIGFALPIYGFFYYSKVAPAWWVCMAIGACIGCVGAIALGTMSNKLAGWNAVPGFILIGVVSAVIFWAIGIRKNATAFPCNTD